MPKRRFGYAFLNRGLVPPPGLVQGRASCFPGLLARGFVACLVGWTHLGSRVIYPGAQPEGAVRRAAMCEWPPKGPAFPLCQHFARAIKHKQGQATGHLFRVRVYALSSSSEVTQRPASNGVDRQAINPPMMALASMMSATLYRECQRNDGGEGEPSSSARGSHCIAPCYRKSLPRRCRLMFL
jgi:hypothetical protein